MIVKLRAALVAVSLDVKSYLLNAEVRSQKRRQQLDIRPVPLPQSRSHKMGLCCPVLPTKGKLTLAG